jgi:type III restriction enzyme
MDLKRFQRRVVDEVETFLHALAGERAKGNKRHGALDAWRECRLGAYQERDNGLGEDFPHFTVKVPTGGGKTLLATQILGSIYRTILQERNGAGLVLWIVPSSQIYRDTLKRLRDRQDMYRLMLEHSLSRRIEVWEKDEIARLSPAKLRDCLNILVIQLASINRASKEQLKFFADSGGNIVNHFPPEDDYEAHRLLKERVPNLEMLEENAERGIYLAKTSIGNLVRLCNPAVILDEGHKAISPLARATIEGANPSIVVELSATPKAVKTASGDVKPNIICKVTGRELLDEEMIKLPLNIATSGEKNWKDVLTQARDKREALAAKAGEYAGAKHRGDAIRPIVLVQVERTGKDQRGPDHIHAEDVREYLMERLSVHKDAIAVKSSEMDELSDIEDLLSPGCLVEWIITKSALQEGWDCPFAYILVSLNNTQSTTGMTQLVGRILRQPFQRRTPFDELNESFVYCLHLRAGQLADAIKKALMQEGLEDAAGMIVNATDRNATASRRVSRMREEFADLYRKPFEGKIYLPHFCVKTDEGYERLDYFRHLVSKVNVEKFDYAAINWELAAELKAAKDRFYRMTLGAELLRENETEVDHFESDAATRAWIVASLPFDYLSHKQLKVIVERVYARLLETELSLRDRLTLVKFIVRDKTQKFVEEAVDGQTKAAFGKLFDKKRLVFYLECSNCRFQIPPELTVKAGRPLAHDNGDLTERSLFDFVPEEQSNNLERAVALALDRDEKVLWWYQNLLGSNSFAIQGWRRPQIHPDFLVQADPAQRSLNAVWVVESKGKQLEGNLDTKYKRDIAEFFSKAGERVTWQQLSEDFKDHQFRFVILDQEQEAGSDWKDELKQLLDS